MHDNTTRRGFLGKSAAVGGSLVLATLRGTGQPARAAEQPAGSPRPAEAGTSTRPNVNAPVAVVTEAVSADVNPRAGTWGYIAEILGRAGVFFDQLSPSQLPLLANSAGKIVLLAGNLQLTSDQRSLLAGFVEKGGTLIGVGGTSGLEAVFGVGGTSPLAEGWIEVSAADHPLTAGLRSSLHVFGGCVAKPASAVSLAQLVGGVKRAARGSAILENRFGQGRAILLTPDLIFSVVHIQQGIPVLQDGKPAPDGSAPLDDGILKAEDGLVLDWQRDRSPLGPDDGPVFLEPVADELREIILRSIFYAAREQDIAMPVLWYWPRGLKAVGHISHDSDGNDPERAAALLEVMNRCKVQSTWCIMYPGYPGEFYDALKKDDFEIALHYDAHSGGERTSWSKDNLAFQHKWLLEAAGLKHIASNKNHYTRWENRLDFFRWCESMGIRSDQTRGPSKKGTIGFPLGGSQPFFPLDDQAERPRLLDVLEVNMLTQDLVIVCPAEYGRQLLDSAARHHGVAHFLFHPAHILKPGVADALCDLVEYGRSQGLQWWTSEQIDIWERRRRGLEARFAPNGVLTLRAAEPLSEATLLVLRPREEPRPVRVDGRPVETAPWSLYGFDFQAVTADLAGEVVVQIG
ncbi:MAG: twin-arginine translocation signal domain-containing protein [Thermoguttaceae bacterium]|jgi:hypothetical protein|nr:twin-arginine translocation signal domain-containing protein [Thermoguttaceae bacterium]